MGGVRVAGRAVGAEVLVGALVGVDVSVGVEVDVGVSVGVDVSVGIVVGVQVGGKVGKAITMGVGTISGLNGLNATRGLIKINAKAITTITVSVATTRAAI